MDINIHVNYEHTANVYTANQFLRNISQFPVIACDFETAVAYTQSQLESFKEELTSCTDKKRRILLESYLGATALGHPSHCTITHCSIATSESDAYVFILDNPRITARILNFLTTTTQRQVWHNASYDFRFIQYFTGRMPILYEDTQIFAKTIINHVENHKAVTGLKQLAGHMYGAWGISDDNFTLDHMYDEKMLRYAATDACACMWLYNSINRHLEKTNAPLSAE